MHPRAELLDLASRIDAKVQRLVREGTDDVSLFAEMADDMPDFKRLLDCGQGTMDELCLRFGGLYHYGKILETIAEAIASGEIQVPK